MGGYGNLPRFLHEHRHVRMAGLYDAGEEQHFLRALGRADRGELEQAGFYACTRDLEDELTRAVGPDGMERLHGFMWNRKQRYAVVLVEALDLAALPRPLDRVLAHIAPPR